MFKKKDFDHIDKMQNTMADGILDATDSFTALSDIVDIICKTDFNSDVSRMEMMMHCINLCYSKDEDGEDVLDEEKCVFVIVALCFNYSNIMSNLVMDGFDIKDYFRFLKEEVIPNMLEESKTIPYWDIDEN